jgi:hypothetical protein
MGPAREKGDPHYYERRLENPSEMFEKTRRNAAMIAIGCLALFLSTRSRASDVALVLSPQDQERITKQLGQGIVGEAVASETIDDPSYWFPLHNEKLIYKFTSGKNVGKTQTETLTRVSRPDGTEAWRLQLAPNLTGYLHYMHDGQIEMPAVEDAGEGAFVITTPANPFLPRGIKPGETRTYSQNISVRYLDDVFNERFTGALKSDYTYVGTFKVKVPAGTFDAILLRVTTDGKIGPAHTHYASYSFFARGTGLVAMILQAKVTAFWIYNVDSAGGKVLLSK